MTGRILVIGSANTDMVVKAARLPAPGETVIGGDFQVFAGGKGANQAVAAARAGGEVAFLGAVGEDSFGQETLENLRREGIDVTGVKQVGEAASGVALITVDKQGENLITVAPGANHLVFPEDLDPVDFGQYRYLVLQLEIPLNAVHAAVLRASAAGCQVILNPAPAQPLPETLLQGIDFLVPNQGELKALAGVIAQAETRPELAKAAQELRTRGVGSVAVTLGAEGVLLVNESRTEDIPAFEVAPVDTVGAGDCFVGCLAAALSQGRDSRNAVLFAMAAAALSTQKPGAQSAMPALKEIEALLETGTRPG